MPAARSATISSSSRPKIADPEATTVIFMPKRTFAALVARLLDHGLSPSTPALFAEHVGHPDQRLIRATIATLAQTLATDAGSGPALILYGPLMDAPA
jgi:uroporphyrin-III C-methyltransferase